MTSTAAAVVFTFKSIDRIAREEGTQSWRMHKSKIGSFGYVICARNRRREEVEGPEPHGSAFLIGRVRDVVLCDDAPERTLPRYKVRISEAATIDIPNFWRWGRWPVHYEDLGSLNIDPDTLAFKPLCEFAEIAPNLAVKLNPVAVDWHSVIEVAKRDLGLKLGVRPSSIEIAVRM